MTVHRRLLTALVPLLLLTGACDAPMSAGADFDPDVDFHVYETFAWEDAIPLPTGDPRLDENPFFDERIREAVTAELVARGIRSVEIDAQPSLLVHYHASVRDRIEVYHHDTAAGYEVSGFEAGTEVYQWEEGTLLVDLVDTESMRVVWRGWSRADVTRALDDLEAMALLLQAAAREMFSHLPREVGVGGA